MVLVTGDGPMTAIPPLPPYVTAGELLADALPLLRPASRISVTECAERYVRVRTAGVWGPFDRTTAPYMVEPADMTQSRRFSTVCFVGPAQSGKTFTLITAALHSVMCDPAPVLILHMTERSRNVWVEEQLNPVIHNSPAIRDKLGQAPEDDTFGRKRFKGMRLAIESPTAQSLSSRSLRMVLLTDFDHMKRELGPADNPEGTPHSMALQRIKTFHSRGCVLVESTPAYEVTDPTWTATQSAPHEMPPVGGGIVKIYNQGTRARWMWECMDCGDLFEPRFDRLVYDATLEPMDAGEAAEMACPHCGGLSAHRHKFELNRRALDGLGGWLHEAADGSLVRVDDQNARRSSVVSYALNGAAATFARWPDMVAKYEAARREYELDRNQLPLRQFWFTDVGVPFVPLQFGDGDDLTLEALKTGRDARPKKVAPDWARFITVSVDVQGTYFPVQVTAWGLDGRRTIIERFDLTQPADGSARKLDPAKFAEDWAVLEPLSITAYPVDGQGCTLRPTALAVDFQGAAGVSDNAEIFWRGRRQNGEGAIWFLSRGYGGFHQRDRVWHQAPDRASGGKRSRGIKLLNMAVDLLKDSVRAALERPADARASFPLPEFLSDDHLLEFIAERRGDKGWEKKPGRTRNESLDLSVQAQALAEHRGLKRINPESPPGWAVLDDRNPHWAALSLAPETNATPDDPPRAARRDKPRQSGGGWIKKTDGWL